MQKARRLGGKGHARQGAGIASEGSGTGGEWQTACRRYGTGQPTGAEPAYKLAGLTVGGKNAIFADTASEAGSKWFQSAARGLKQSLWTRAAAGTRRRRRRRRRQAPDGSPVSLPNTMAGPAAPVKALRRTMAAVGGECSARRQGLERRRCWGALEQEA